MQKIICGDEIIYIDGLENFSNDGDPYEDNGIRDLLSLDTLKNALNPIVKVGKIMKQGFSEIAPDEVELTLQLQLGVSADKLVFAIVNTEAQAHLSIKFLWKPQDITDLSK